MSERGDAQATDEEREDAETEPNAEGEAEPDASHLDDIEDGAGCTEIWERLSERRES
ncbi:hypothetical protein [Halorubrum kocurii]|uniref:Uncharacterized protein n=1 Tax=Halorubrum kocurii JCM 14978 TaxID=1230456 RepID=M0NQI7_9EURY|nr:hypothetical protein [Halorubrum kocurii]EMA60001.1 hypothetical protein C468_13481 [Halorubrum kocurii JCM 14978]